MSKNNIHDNKIIHYVPSADCSVFSKSSCAFDLASDEYIVKDSDNCTTTRSSHDRGLG